MTNTRRPTRSASGKNVDGDVVILKEEDMDSGSPVAKKERTLPEYTMEEVGMHNNKEDLWLAIDGGVYNVTKWAPEHPGGILALIHLAGKDASDPFLAFHQPHIIAKRLPKFKVGTVKDYKRPQIRQDAMDIRDEMRRNGDYNTSMPYYAMQWGKCAMIMLGVLFLLSLANVASESGSFLSHWFYVLAAGATLGIFWQQILFIGHDAGHGSITQSYEGDGAQGVVISALCGISIQWWKKNHNTHHIITNSMHHDPDIQHMPFLAVSEFFLSGFTSSYYNKEFVMDAVSTFFLSFQHRLFFIVMGLARFNLYALSIAHTLDPKTRVRGRAWEIGSVIVFWTWFLSLVFVLPTHTERILFVLSSHLVAGIIHLQITLSHFAMPAFEGSPYDSSDPAAFYASQLETTLDIDCSTYMDWFHGGLQFQVEHHIFPRVPRHKLRWFRMKYMEPFAKKHGLKHRKMAFLDAISFVLSKLESVAQEARKMSKPGTTENFLITLLNSEG